MRHDESSRKTAKKKRFLIFSLLQSMYCNKMNTKTYRSLFFSTFVFDFKNKPQDTTILCFFLLFFSFSLPGFVEVFPNFLFLWFLKKKEKLASLFFVTFQKKLFLSIKKKASCAVWFAIHFCFSFPKEVFFLFGQLLVILFRFHPMFVFFAQCC